MSERGSHYRWLKEGTRRVPLEWNPWLLCHKCGGVATKPLGKTLGVVRHTSTVQHNDIILHPGRAQKCCQRIVALCTSTQYCTPYRHSVRAIIFGLGSLPYLTSGLAHPHCQSGMPTEQGWHTHPIYCACQSCGLLSGRMPAEAGTLCHTSDAHYMYGTVCYRKPNRWHPWSIPPTLLVLVLGLWNCATPLVAKQFKARSRKWKKSNYLISY